MSIASAFRDKWNIVVTAVDSTHGQGEERDHRYAVAAKAIDAAGLVLTDKAVIDAYQRRIKELDGELSVARLQLARALLASGQ